MSELSEKQLGACIKSDATKKDCADKTCHRAHRMSELSEKQLGACIKSDATKKDCADKTCHRAHRMSELFTRAKEVIPGGVNSPVRGFNSVGGEPVFIKSANGFQITDINEKNYIDYVCSWGPMILGHNHEIIKASVLEAVDKGLSFGAPTEIEVKIAELIVKMVPNIDMVRMVNSGTEAVMSALRLARGYSGKEKIIKFEGCYHGHTDSMLVNAGSGVVNVSASAGVGQSNIENTLIAKYNDISSVENLLNKNEVAAVIIEPVAANMGVVPPNKDFLQNLRQLCTKHKTLLIFDEVITGFRLGAGGAQEYYNVKADIVTMGKIIGGGMPVGAYGGKKEIMSMIAPLGNVYQAGTLSGNPVAMSAGYAQLKYLAQNPNVYKQINSNAQKLKTAFEDAINKLDVPCSVNCIGSLLNVFFTKEKVTDFTSAKTSNTANYGIFFHKMLEKGINLAPAQFEAMFVSFTHTDEAIDITIKTAYNSLKEMKDEGVF